MATELALKVPPNSVQMEQAVLSGVLGDPLKLDEVAEILQESDFYRSEHRVIFLAYLWLINENKPIDYMTLADRLSETGEIEHAGGSDYIAELASNTHTSSNLIHYAKQVRSKAVARDIISASNSICDAAYAGKDDPETLLANYQAKLAQIGLHATDGGLIHVNKIAQQLVDTIDERAGSESSMVGLSTGYVDLDKLTMGFCPGNLIVIAGRPSMGKTALAMNIAENVALADGTVHVFSLEMPREDLLSRCYASIGNLDLAKIRSGNLNDDDWPKLNKAVASLMNKPLYIDDQAGVTSSQIRGRVRRTMAETGLPVSMIVVDYLQIMGDPMQDRGNETQRIGTITRTLKAISKEFSCPVVLISQLSRDVDKRNNRRPVLSDLRASGDIEQDADLIIFMYREEYYKPDTHLKGIAEALIAKHRNGPLGQVDLTFMGQYCRFENSAGRQDKVPHSKGNDQMNWMEDD